MELDWALVELNASREGDNKLPDALSFPTNLHLPDHWNPPSPPRISGIVGPLGLETVFKVGRSTGRTGGIVNGIKTDISTEGSERNGVPPRQSPTRAWVVVRAGGLNFADVGDSGSFVLDPQGRWAGVIWGGNAGQNLTYFVEAYDVVHDITNVTSWTFVDE